eukprot:gene11438-23926_t
MCPEQELPVKNCRIKIREYPMGLNDPFISWNSISPESCHVKILHYEEYEPIHSINMSRKVKRRRVVYVASIRGIARAIIIVGDDRVRDRGGAPYFAPNNKVIAFHIGNISPKHSSYSRGLVLCRLSQSKEWYNRILVPSNSLLTELV